MPTGEERSTGFPRTIRYTTAPCDLGRVLLAATGQGICAVSLGDTDTELVQRLRTDYPAAELRRDDFGLSGWRAKLLGHLAGTVRVVNLPLDITGTVFQRRVWEQLQLIPLGQTQTYQQVAQAIGQPTAARAVARACAQNPVAVLIPCHRVLGSDGSLRGYEFGIERKRQLLVQERRLLRQGGSAGKNAGSRKRTTHHHEGVHGATG